MNLAYRLRPETLEEYIGQEHLVGKNKLLQKMLETGNISSMIFWGPPGSGKTTLANLIAKAAQADFHHLSAVETGKADLMRIIREAEEKKKAFEKANVILGTNNVRTPESKKDSGHLPAGKAGARMTILFLDEIHRWNKAQQDTLLPYVENGTLTLIGATTENPSFEVISALLSRCRVFVLQSLTPENLSKIIDRALVDKERGIGKYLPAGRQGKKTITHDAKELLIRLSGGDARIMLNALEMAATTFTPVIASRAKQSQTEKIAATSSKSRNDVISVEIIKEIFQTKSAGLYDKKAEEHYNIISAFIKSMRGSDVDAALYYLARMLENGEDPKFIARRMIIFASEDIGLSDRGALIQANQAFEAVTKIGMPEAQLTIAHVVIYLASAKKSRAVANAIGRAKQAVYEFPNEPIPLHLRNAPTKLMKDLGYAKEYTWSDNYVGPKGEQSFLPEKLKGKKFYE